MASASGKPQHYSKQRKEYEAYLEAQKKKQQEQAKIQTAHKGA